MTRQQQLIYDIVASGPAHPTAEEVFVRAREALPSLARGTVYRNLGRLTEEGRIGKVEMPGAPARYDRLSRPHPHWICPVCGRVEDLPPLSEELLERLAPSETIVTGYDLKLFCVCAPCRIKQEEKSS